MLKQIISYEQHYNESNSVEQTLETSLNFTSSFEKNSANDYGFAIAIIRFFLICVRCFVRNYFGMSRIEIMCISQIVRDAEVLREIRFSTKRRR